MIQFSVPCFEVVLGLAEKGLVVVGQALVRWKDRESWAFKVRLKEPQNGCPDCQSLAKPRGTRGRWVVHAPIGTRPVWLLLRLRCFTCPACGRYWQEMPEDFLVGGRCSLTKKAQVWALAAVVLDSMSVRSAARNLGASWNRVNTAVLDAGLEHLISDETRFEGVNTIGVDEHCWRHKGWMSERFVTVIMDLTPRQKGMPARLLDMVPGRSKEVLKTWLEAQDSKFRMGVKVASMDGFTGYKNAVKEALPSVTTVMDPFHVVQLAGDKLNLCRQRLQQETMGRRGRAGDPLYQTRRLLLTNQALLSEKTWNKVSQVITDTKFIAITRIWNVYQGIIKTYGEKDRVKGRTRLAAIIDALQNAKTKGIPELITLKNTLKKRREDILAYFTHPAASNGPTEALNGRLEHLRGTALGFRNIENYIKRSLLHTGGFKTKIQSYL